MGFMDKAKDELKDLVGKVKSVGESAETAETADTNHPNEAARPAGTVQEDDSALGADPELDASDADQYDDRQ